MLHHCTLILFDLNRVLIFKPFDIKSLRFNFTPYPKTFRNFVTMCLRLLKLIRVYVLAVTGKTRRVMLSPSKNGLVMGRDFKNSCNSEPSSGVKIFSAFWGSTHTLLFRDICLPSLLQSGIFSSDFKMPINFVIYCPAKDWLKIESDVRAMVDHAGATCKWSELDRPEFTDDTVLNRKVEIVKFLRGQVRFADNSDQVLVFAFPDLVFGRGLDRVIQSMERGDYVVCPTARVNLEGSTETLKELLIANRYSNRDLVRISMEEFPHHIVKIALSESHSYRRIRKKRERYVVNFKEPPPLAVWCSSDLFESSFKRPFFGEFEVVDHDAPSLFFRKSKLRLVNSSDLFFWAELTPKDSYKMMIKNQFWAASAIYLNQCEVAWNL